MIEAPCTRQIDVLLMDHDLHSRLGEVGASALRGWTFPIAHKKIAPSLLAELDYEALVCWDSFDVTPINTKRSSDEIINELIKEYTGKELDDEQLKIDRSAMLKGLEV